MQGLENQIPAQTGVDIDRYPPSIGIQQTFPHHCHEAPSESALRPNTPTWNSASPTVIHTPPNLLPRQLIHRLCILLPLSSLSCPTPTSSWSITESTTATARRRVATTGRGRVVGSRHSLDIVSTFTTSNEDRMILIPKPPGLLRTKGSEVRD